MTKKIVFLHIPKTAGTSVHEMLKQHFDEKQICPERFRGLAKYSIDELKKFDLFSGHFIMPHVDKIPGEKFVFTILREPAERILSLYYFWRRHEPEVAVNNRLAGPLAANAMLLPEFLRAEHDISRGAIFNEMARVLAGHIGVTDQGRYFDLSRNDRPEISEFDVVRRALSALLRIDYVGFVDTIDRDMRNIFELAGLPRPTEVPRRRTANDTTRGLLPVEYQALDGECESHLSRLTSLDRIVYTLARSRTELMVRQKNASDG